MRLVYIYVSNGSADVNNIPKWNPDVLSQDPFTLLFPEEGFCYLFKKFIQERLFDEILIAIESSRSPGMFYISQGISGIVVPHINELKKFMRDDDILWARGGWRSWFPFLQEWHDKGRWLLFYRAASNRGAWPFWDIVLDDLRTQCDQDGIGRFYYPINKPINPDIFFPMEDPDGNHELWDIMAGASHIHDKKGQYKIIPIMIEYRRQFNKDLQCIMPGSMKHGTCTSEIMKQIGRFDLKIRTTGMVTHDYLRYLYNHTKLFVHLGGAGQNDRGPLEAMACGTPVILANEQYHAPCICSNHTPLSFHIDPDEPILAARQLNFALQMIKDDWWIKTYNYFQSVNGIATIYPRFAALFNRIFQTPWKDKQKWFNSLLNKEE